MGQYIRRGLICKMPPRFNLESMEAGSDEYYDGLWDYTWAPYVSDFELAIGRDDIDGADVIWSRAAVHFLAEATQAPDYSDRGIVRGDPPSLNGPGRGRPVCRR